jgi:hypothetical protein
MNAITSWSEFDERYAALLKRIPDSVQVRIAEASEGFAKGHRGAAPSAVWAAAACKRGIDEMRESREPNLHVPEAVRLLRQLEVLVTTDPVLQERKPTSVDPYGPLQ